MSDDAYPFELSSPKTELADALDELADLGLRVTDVLRKRNLESGPFDKLRSKSAHAKLLAAELRDCNLPPVR